MTRAKNLLLTLALLAVVALPSQALFGPPTETFTGVVNFIQQTNFTVLLEGNSIVRIKVPSNMELPSSVQVGTVVSVKAELGEDNAWYLQKFERIESLPGR